ncbi:MAG: TolC family protein [Flavobacteriaceae bacterium]|nr:TolC family protein [Flavobacteriaceae bacterium]
MKTKFLLITLIAVCCFGSLEAQQEPLNLSKAVGLALNNSDKARVVEARVDAAGNQLQVVKNSRYPDVKVSGQYLHLTNAKVDLKLNLNSGADNSGSDQGGASPKVNRLMLGQAAVTMPLFSGFKLKNTVKASENLYEAASLNAQSDKEDIAMNTIQAYINLYKARQAVMLIQENLKSAQQRAADFTAMEQNGILDRNDLLKARLQESDVELSLEEAKKNEHILSYKLTTFLKLPEETVLDPGADDFNISALDTVSQVKRADLEALHYQEQAAEDHVKVARSKYYPALALTGGYIDLDLHNALTVSNAMNAGIGLSYNLSDLFKAKSEVKLAQSKVQELQFALNDLDDNVRIQVKNAEDEYQLALKRLEVYAKSEEQAAENYRIVKDKFDNGLADTNDLLEADVAQLNARINKANARADIALQFYKMEAARGQLLEFFKN